MHVCRHSGSNFVNSTKLHSYTETNVVYCITDVTMVKLKDELCVSVWISCQSFLSLNSQFRCTVIIMLLYHDHSQGQLFSWWWCCRPLRFFGLVELFSWRWGLLRGQSEVAAEKVLLIPDLEVFGLPSMPYCHRLQAFAMNASESQTKANDHQLFVSCL